MFTFNNFKRFIVLLFVLLGAVSGFAQSSNVLVVNTTKEHEEGKLSFVEALDKANNSNGMTIQFDLPEGSKIQFDDNIRVETPKELTIDGEKHNITIITEKSELVFNGSEELTIRNLNFEKTSSSEDGLNAVLSVSGNTLNIQDIHFVNCCLEATGYMESFTGGIATAYSTNIEIRDCSFKDAKYGIYINDDVVVDSIVGNIFNNLEKAIFNSKVGRINGVKDNIFSMCKTAIVTNGRILEIRDCDFLNLYYGVHIFGFVDEIKRSKFESCTECAILGENYKNNSISSSLFKNNKVDINGLSPLYLYKCEFFINAKKRSPSIIVSEETNYLNTKSCILYNTFHIDLNEPDPGFIIIDDNYKTIIEKNKFIGEGNGALCSYAKGGAYVTQNIFDYGHSVQALMLIDQGHDRCETPKISTVEFNNGQYQIIGTSIPGAVIEVFLSNGYFQNAIKYLSMTKADENGKFSLSVPSSMIGSNPPVFNATATVNQEKTSNLSSNVTFFPKEIYVKVKGSGNGDGRNWKNAMSFETFWSFFDKVPNGTTFHFAEGDYELDNQIPNTPSFLTINSSIKIIGGYPVTNEEDVTKVKSNPTLHSTNFKRVGTGDAYFKFNKTGVDVEFHNMEFFDTWLGSNNVTLNRIVIDSCKFSNCIALKSVSSDKLEIRNSLFTSEKDESPITFNKYKGTATIENSTFIATSKKGSILAMEQLSDASVSNCTFYGNTVDDLIHICANNKLELLNNTFIGSSDQSVVFSTNYPDKTKIVGNIIYGSCLSEAQSKEFDTDKYNVTSKETSVGNNYVADFTTILEGKNVNGKFTPILAYNGGFTPTVKMVKDRLSDNTDIRFDRTLTNLDTDQRGVKRLDNTCPGAYEMECVASSPTISVESVTPYSCQEGDVTDGSLTISVKNWATSNKAYKDGKSCTPTKVNGTVATFTFNELGKESKFTFSVEDNCGNTTKKEIDMQALSKENGLFLFTYITAGAGRDKNDDPNEPACALDDHRIKMTVKGGSAPYVFEVFNSKKQRVVNETVNLANAATGYTYTSEILPPDDYVVYVSDASGCRYGDSKHANFTAKNTLALSAYKSECNGEKSIHLMVNGSTSGSVALYRDNNDKDPYVAALMPLGKEYADVPGVYEYGVATLKDGCFAYSPINYIPLSQSFMYKLYDILITKPFTTVEPTCIGQKGSITIYPESELENTIYSGFTYVCNLADATSGEIIQAKEDIIDLNAPVTFEDVDPGKYTVYFSYLLGECAQGSGSKKSVEISGVDIPAPLPVSMSIMHDNWCDPADGGRDFSIKNWTENYYTARLYSTDLTEESNNDNDLPYVAGESEKLLRDNIEPTSISTNKSAIFEIRGLKGGFYRFVVSDPCGKSWMNRVFKVDDDVKPTPRIETLATPYSCKTKDAEVGKDGSITVRVYDYYSSRAWIDDKVVLPDDSGSDYYDFIMKDLGPGDKRTFKLVDVCNKEQVLDLDMTELAKENGLFYIKNATLKTGSDCFADNRKIEYEARGGMPAYNFKVFNKGTGEEVYDYTAYPLTGSTNILLVGDYKLIATDKNGCIDEVNDGLEVTTIRTLKAAKTNLCDGYFHVDLNYDGTLVSAKVYEKKNGRTKKVYFDEGSDNKSFVMKGEYDGVIVSFSPDGCQGLALFDEAEEKPLSIAFASSPQIEDQTCPGEDNGKYTCFPASQINLRGYKMYLVITNKSTGKVRMDSVTQSGTRMSVDRLPAGNYEAFIALGYNGCVVDASKKVLDDFSIKSVEKPTLTMDNSAFTIRCEGVKQSVLVKVTNYDKNLYSWKLTKDEEDISSSAKVSAPSGSEGSFVLGNLTAGSYVFSLVDKCGKPYTCKFTVKESVKPALVFSDHHQGVSCDGGKDGRVAFVVTNWSSTEDQAVLTNTTTNEVVECTPYVKGSPAVASWTVAGLSGGKYTLTVTEYCGTKYDPQVADLDELNKSSKFGLSLAEASADAECNADNRVLSATVSGLENQAPYTYVLYKVDGEEEKVIDDKQKEVTDRTYTSKKLDYGTYKLVAVNNNGCEVSVSRTFSASHTLTGTRVVCGTNTHVELDYDGVIEGVSVKVGGSWSDIAFPTGTDKTKFDFKGVVTDVRVKENGCATEAALSDVDLSADMFAGVTAKATPINQTCYGENNGSIRVTYSGYKGNMQVVAYAGEKKSTYDEESKSLVISGLAPGSYDVKLGFEINGCEVASQSLKVAEGVKIQPVEKPTLSMTKKEFVILCEGQKQSVLVNVTNYDKNLYSWKLTKDEEDISSIAKVSAPSTASGAFVLGLLTAGTYEFSLVDQCDNAYPYGFVVSEKMKPAFTFSSAHKGISCEGKSDGVVSFSVGNWDNDNDKAVFKNLTTGKVVEEAPVYEDGTVTYAVSGVSGGKYSLSLTEYCGRKYDEQVVDIDELSKSSKFGISLAEASADADCNEDSRVLSATVSGLENQAPYTYVLYKVDGEEEKVIDDKQKEVTDRTYTSKKLDYGTYKLVAVNNNGCEVSVSRTFSASHTLTGTRVVCGTNTHVELDYDGVIEGVSVKVGGSWSDIAFPTGTDKTKFDFKGVVTDVRVKENGCATEAALSDVDLSADMFAGVTAKATPINQTCYGENNGSIRVTYSGYKGNMQVVAYAGEKKSTYDEESKSLVISGLAPGSYDVKLGFEINGCEVASQSLKVADNLLIKALEEPKFLEDNYKVVHNQCEGGNKGRMHLEMMGWKDGIYSWSIKRETDTGEPDVNTHCGEKLANGATAFDLWTLPEGEAIFTMWDACKRVYTKTDTIKADYAAPLTIDMGENKAYTCADRADGSLTFVTSDWDVEDKVEFKKNGKAMTEKITPVIKEGKAYFQLKNQGSGVYTITTTDLCDRTAEMEFDLTAFSEANGALGVEAAFDDNAETCEAGKRSIQVTAKGGSAPYIYMVVKNGTAVETSEALDTTTYNSGLLGEGKYSVSVTDNSGCKVIFGEDLEIDKLDVKLGELAKKEQSCYGKNNAGVSVDYSGLDSMMAKLRLLITEKTEAENKKTYEVFAGADKGTLAYTELPAGAYNVKVQLLGRNGCEMSNGVLLDQEIEFEALEKPEFIEENYSTEPNRCKGADEGRMHLEMMGWKDGIYSWTIKRAGSPDGEMEVYHHCGEKLENGAVAFDLWGLPVGLNVFTIKDGCGYNYSKTGTIKADYVAPISLDLGDTTAYTCADRSDGSLSFVASPWFAGDEVVVRKNGKQVDVSPVVKDGKATYSLSKQGAGIFTLEATDLCGRTTEMTFNFTAFSEKNGLFHISAVDFDAEAAGCNLDKRFVKFNVSGGKAPYVYKVLTTEGSSIQTSETVGSSTFTSDLLPDGKFKLVAVDNTQCESVYDDGLEIVPFVKLEAQKREVVCDDKKYTLVTVNHEGVNNEREYWFMDADQNNETKVVLGGTIDSAVIVTPVDVTFTQVRSFYSTCDLYAQLTELPLDNAVLTEADANVRKVYKQRCFGRDNGGVVVDYSGPETVYPVAIKLVDKKDASHFYYSDAAKSNKDSLKIEIAAPGEYELFLVHKLGNCDLEGMTRKLKDITIAALTEPLALYADETKVHQSNCYSAMNARSVVAATGWTEDVYTLRFYDYNEKGELHERWHGMNANHLTYVTDAEVYAWSTGENLTAGKYYVTWGDMCNAEIIKHTFTVEPLKKPSIKLLESSYVDLKCNYDKAYVDFHYEGGAPVNKRILIKYKADDEDEDWEYTTEELKAENTYRLYGFTPGPGLQGHEKAEGTDYELTDEDKGLPDGHYYIFYQDDSGKCPDDEENVSITVSRPQLLKQTVSTEDALCEDLGGSAKATATGGVAPYAYYWYGPKKNLISAQNIVNGLVPGDSYTSLVVDKNGCSARLNDIKVDFKKVDVKALDDVKADIKGLRQQCYGVSNGAVIVTYSGNKSDGDLQFYAVDANGEKHYGSAINKEYGIDTVKGLAPGEYDVFIDVVLTGCKSTASAKNLGHVTIDGIAGPFKMELVKVYDPTCKKMADSGNPNGKVHVRISNWYDGYTLKLFENDELYYTFNDGVQLDEDGLTANVVATGRGGGHELITLNDVCGNETKVETDMSIIKAPKFTEWEKKEMLKCNLMAENYVRDAYVKYYFSGGSEKGGNIVLSYSVDDKPHLVKDKDGNYTISMVKVAGGEPVTETITADSAHTYTLDSLTLRTYTMAYKTTVEGCADEASVSFSPKQPKAIESLIAVEPITCIGTETAEFSLVVNGKKLKKEYYALKDAKNFAHVYLMSRGYDLGAYKPELYAELLKIGFPGINKMEIDTMDAEGNYGSADQILINGVEKNKGNYSEFPLPDFWQPLKDIGESMYGDSVYRRWIDFGNLPANYYYLVTTDDNECRFVETINLTKTPDDPLTIDQLEYLADADNDAACDANNRRVKLHISGGWPEGYVVGIRDINDAPQKTEEELLEELNNQQEDDDSYYGTPVRSLTYQEGDTMLYNDTKTAATYKSGILRPGTYTVTVIDYRGCQVTADRQIEVKSHIDVSATMKINLCDQNEGNYLYPKATFNKPYNGGQITSYALRYEDTHVGEKVPVKNPMVLEGVPSGLIGVFAYDENGCSGYDTFYVPKKDITLLHFLVFDNLKTNCYGYEDGQLIFNLSGGYWPYKQLTLKKDDNDPMVLIDENKKTLSDIKWQTEEEVKKGTSSSYQYKYKGDFSVESDTFKVSDKFTYSGLGAGNYTMEVTDNKNCKQSLDFKIEQPDQILFDTHYSPICPDDSARIYPSNLRGGYAPYSYAVVEAEAGKKIPSDLLASLTEDQYGSEDHVKVEIGDYVYVVRDSNNCFNSSGVVSVADVRQAGVDDDILVAKYHDLDDVLAIVNVTDISKATPKPIEFDSFKVEVQIVGDNPMGLEAEEMPKELYMYGVPEGVDTLVIWDDIKIPGPQWGVPADIAAGLKTKEEYAKADASVSPIRKTYNGIKDSIALINKHIIVYAQDDEKLKSKMLDSLAYLNVRKEKYGSILSEKSRDHCTIDMIKKYFKDMGEGAASAKRKTFIKLTHKSDKSKHITDFESIDYIIRTTTYISGCSYVTERNSLSMYPNGGTDTIYKLVGEKEIVETSVTPNLIKPGENSLLNVKLSNTAEKLGAHVEIYNTLGALLATAELQNETKNGAYYHYTADLNGFTESIIIVITTRHERATERMLVYGYEGE